MWRLMLGAFSDIVPTLCAHRAPQQNKNYRKNENKRCATTKNRIVDAPVRSEEGDLNKAWGFQGKFSQSKRAEENDDNTNAFYAEMDFLRQENYIAAHFMTYDDGMLSSETGQDEDMNEDAKNVHHEEIGSDISVDIEDEPNSYDFIVDVEDEYSHEHFYEVVSFSEDCDFLDTLSSKKEVDDLAQNQGELQNYEFLLPWPTVLLHPSSFRTIGGVDRD